MVFKEDICPKTFHEPTKTREEILMLMLNPRKKILKISRLYFSMIKLYFLH